MPRIRAASIDEHKEMTRRAILDAARELIAEIGTAEVSLGELTAAAGIGRTTFYEYFSDRDDVIASLVEEELPGVIAELISAMPDGSTEERLADLVVATVEFVVDNPVLGLILHREVPRLGQDAQDRIMDAHAGLSREMGQIYMTGVNEGVFRRLDPELAGRLIQDTIMSTAKTIIGSEQPAVRAAEITGGLRNFLLSGLRSETSTDKTR
ncbi:MAG: TetR/AcrR family transcriptional regulator [Acidimicrobiia bacterium]